MSPDAQITDLLTRALDQLGPGALARSRGESDTAWLERLTEEVWLVMWRLALRDLERVQGLTPY